MSKKGFTLIELLVVVAVLALLASIVFSNLGGAREGARISNALAFQSQTHSLLGSDLVGWWNFNEGSGTTARDISGYDNHGNIVGATRVAGVPGTLGGAMEFSRSDNGIELSNGVLSDNESFTILAWVKPHSFSGSSYYYIFDQWSSGEPGRFHFSLYEGRIANRIGGTLRMGPEVETGIFSHVVLTRDSAGSIKFFLDGHPSEASSNTNPILYKIPWIGGYGTYRFDGIIDDVRIYSRALSASEIQTLYTQTKDRYLANE